MACNPIPSGSRGSSTRRPPAGLTLLELILALALSGLIMYAVAFAISIHLRTLDVRRTNVEEAQLARTVLQMIATDLHGVIRYEPQDMSALQKLIASAAVPDAGGGTESGGGGDGGEGGDDPRGDTGGTSGDTGGTSGGTGGTSGIGDLTGASDSLEESPYTAELVDSEMLPPVPGLYGNAYQLQIDVSRLPRPDQYLLADPMTGELPTGDIPSDVKTVTYYIQTPTPIGGVQDAFADPLGPSVTSGLVRRELDRSVTQYASDNGMLLNMTESGELLAPEIIAIEFQYFDGFQWLTEWDSDQMQALPMAIMITLTIAPRDSAAQASTPLSVAPQLSTTGLVYRMLVKLPLGEPVELEEEAAADEGMESLGL